MIWFVLAVLASPAWPSIPKAQKEYFSGAVRCGTFLQQRPNLCLERCPRPDQITDHPTNEPEKVITQEHVRFSINCQSDKVCNRDKDFSR
jgi:hypothetical protein